MTATDSQPPSADTETLSGTTPGTTPGTTLGSEARATGRLKLALVLVAAVALVVLGKTLPLESWMGSVKEFVGALGAWGPIVYGLFYVIAALLFIPGSAITIAAGALFGLGTGTVVVSLASTTAAALALPLARTALRSRVEAFAAERSSFRAIDEAITDGGWKIVGLLRLSPVVPFSALNYLLGLTNVRYIPAVLVSWIAMLPGTLLYVYFGAIGRDVAAGKERGPFEWALMIAGLVATLAVTIVLTRMARARMRENVHIDA